MTNKNIISHMSNIMDEYLHKSFQKYLRKNENNQEILKSLLGQNQIIPSNTTKQSSDYSSVRAERPLHYLSKGSDNILPPISKLKKDSLSRFGYRLSKSKSSRKNALKKATRSRGTLTVLKRVNLIGNYSKSNPINYEKLRSDVEFLKNEYAKEKIKKIKKKLSKRSKNKYVYNITY